MDANKISLTTLFLLSSLFYLTAEAASPTVLTAGFTLGGDSNLSLARATDDQIADQYANINFDISHTLSITNQHSIKLGADILSQAFNEYDGLNHTDFILSADYILQPYKNYTAAWYTLNVDFGSQDYDDNKRDSNILRFGLTYSKRLTDRLQINAGYQIESIDADAVPVVAGQTVDINYLPTGISQYETFDNDRDTFFVSANIKQNRYIDWYASLSFISGDITANWSDSEIDAIGTTDPGKVIAWETIIDDIYGANRQSTKYGVDTTRLAIGMNYAFNRYSATDVVIEYLEADAGDYSYSVGRASMNYLYRF